MITFETQEDFEEAVMEVIRSRVKVAVVVGKTRMAFCSEVATKVEVSLVDNDDCTVFTSGNDHA